jgi:hypothetical protein
METTAEKFMRIIEGLGLPYPGTEFEQHGEAYRLGMVGLDYLLQGEKWWVICNVTNLKTGEEEGWSVEQVLDALKEGNG